MDIDSGCFQHEPDEQAPLTTILLPGSFLYAKTRRKDPGGSWSRATQIMSSKLELMSGRGGRGTCVSCLKMLRLKID